MSQRDTSTHERRLSEESLHYEELCQISYSSEKTSEWFLLKMTRNYLKQTWKIAMKE
jgi:hypothetical protein